MRKIQTQGVHHITLTGADRQSTIDFWEGVLGMPFVFEQPNLDAPDQGHLYFDPGDGRLITVFTSEDRKPGRNRIDQGPGSLHHLAFNVSKVTFDQVVERLDARGVKHSGVKDRGFMDSIYFREPGGVLHFAFDLDGLPPGATVEGAVLKLTVAGPGAAYEFTTTLR